VFVEEDEPVDEIVAEAKLVTDRVAETDTLDDMLPVTVTLPVVDGLADDDLHDVVVPD
jgi:hypothetical protein